MITAALKFFWTCVALKLVDDDDDDDDNCSFRVYLLTFSILTWNTGIPLSFNKLIFCQNLYVIIV